MEGLTEPTTVVDVLIGYDNLRQVRGNFWRQTHEGAVFATLANPIVCIGVSIGRGCIDVKYGVTKIWLRFLELASKRLKSLFQPLLESGYLWLTPLVILAAVSSEFEWPINAPGPGPSPASFSKTLCDIDATEHRAQAFPRHVIVDVEAAEAAAKGKLVVEKVDRPARIGLCPPPHSCNSLGLPRFHMTT